MTICRVEGLYFTDLASGAWRPDRKGYGQLDSVAVKLAGVPGVGGVPGSDLAESLNNRNERPYHRPGSPPECGLPEEPESRTVRRELPSGVGPVLGMRILYSHRPRYG